MVYLSIRYTLWLPPLVIVYLYIRHTLRLPSLVMVYLNFRCTLWLPTLVMVYLYTCILYSRYTLSTSSGHGLLVLQVNLV
jgi:hypothetical protein